MMNELSNTNAVNKITLPPESEAYFLATHPACPLQEAVLRFNRTDEQLQEICNLMQRYEAELRQDAEKKAKKIQDEAWKRHKVHLYPANSRQGLIKVSVVDCSLCPKEQIADYKWLRTFFKRNAAAKQLSFSANQEEERDLQGAAEYCNIPVSAFVLQAATGVARFILEVTEDFSSPVEVEQVCKLLYQAHALRDTKLFTEEEVLRLGLTPEQLHRFADLLESKQGGLPTVAEP